MFALRKRSCFKNGKEPYNFRYEEENTKVNVHNLVASGVVAWSSLQFSFVRFFAFIFIFSHLFSQVSFKSKIGYYISQLLIAGTQTEPFRQAPIV